LNKNKKCAIKKVRSAIQKRKIIITISKEAIVKTVQNSEQK